MRFPPRNAWQQLYSIHVYEYGQFFPAVAIAMTRRTTAIYVHVLTSIKQWISDEFDLDWKPQIFLTDFEVALRAALPVVFGQDLRHKACYFHFSRAIYTRLEKMNLAAEYNTDCAFNEYIRKLKSLALVPADSLGECLRHVLDFKYVIMPKFVRSRCIGIRSVIQLTGAWQTMRG